MHSKPIKKNAVPCNKTNTENEVNKLHIVDDS